MKYDYIIVGAGFAGAVCAERIANELNSKCLVIEKRSHIGGQCYDYIDENGIMAHKYGPHIFHTQNQKVWDYLSKFTEWREFYHKVLGVIDGIKVPVPFNLNSLHKFFPEEYANRLEKKLIDTYGPEVKIPILKMKENADSEIRELAEFVYNNVFLGYTVKQWGMKPEELDFSVTSRVPVFISRDDRYFQDKYQAIPLNGYTKLFENLLNHPNITVQLNTDYKDIINQIEFKKLIYTGPIDSYFDYKFGKLPYRSLEFDLKTVNVNRFQETAQVNYSNDFDYTRITEFAHFLDQNLGVSTLAYEYPKEFILGENEPYYPIPKAENEQLFAQYKSEAEILKDKVVFLGRLAEYKYYNMDQVIGVALMTFEKEIAVNN